MFSFCIFGTFDLLLSQILISSLLSVWCAFEYCFSKFTLVLLDGQLLSKGKEEIFENYFLVVSPEYKLLSLSMGAILDKHHCQNIYFVLDTDLDTKQKKQFSIETYIYI